MSFSVPENETNSEENRQDDGTPASTSTTATTTTKRDIPWGFFDLEPPKWNPNCAVNWFKMVELQFSLIDLTDELAKFYYVLTSLPLEELSEDCFDLANRPGCYEALKKSMLATFDRPKGVYVKFNSFEELRDMNIARFDGNLLNWNAYRRNLIDEVLSNPKLSNEQIFFLIFSGLDDEIIKSAAFTKYFQRPSALTRFFKRRSSPNRNHSTYHLLSFLDHQYGTGYPAYKRMLATIESLPNLAKNDTVLGREKLLVVAKEVLRRANYGYYDWFQKKILLSTLVGRLSNSEKKQFNAEFLPQHILYLPTINVHLEKCVDLIEKGPEE